jgi:hypothetical protein
MLAITKRRDVFRLDQELVSGKSDGLLEFRKKKIAMPADWPNNALLDDRVIVPPANNIADARKRKEQYDCCDWWFCHKPLDK